MPLPLAPPEPLAAPAAEPEPLVVPLPLIVEPPVVLPGVVVVDDPPTVPLLGEPSVPPLEPPAVPLPLPIVPDDVDPPAVPPLGEFSVPLPDPLVLGEPIVPPVAPLVLPPGLVPEPPMVPLAALPAEPPVPFFACPGGTPVRDAESSLWPGVRPPARDGVLPLAPGERVVLELSLLSVPLFEPLFCMVLPDDMSVDVLPPVLVAACVSPARPRDKAALAITAVVLIMRSSKDVMSTAPCAHAYMRHACRTIATLSGREAPGQMLRRLMRGVRA